MFKLEYEFSGFVKTFVSEWISQTVILNLKFKPNLLIVSLSMMRKLQPWNFGAQIRNNSRDICDTQKYLFCKHKNLKKNRNFPQNRTTTFVQILITLQDTFLLWYCLKRYIFNMAKRKVSQEDLRKMMAQAKTSKPSASAPPVNKKYKLSSREVALLEVQKKEAEGKKTKEMERKAAALAALPKPDAVPRKTILKNITAAGNLKLQINN